MHELPKDLDKSLRSWRGSIYGQPGDEADDLEKGWKVEDYGEQEVERTLNPKKSSMILHPTASRQALHEAYMQPYSQQQQQQLQQSSLRDFHAHPRRVTYNPAPLLTSPTALAKRQPTANSNAPGTATSTKKSIFSAPPVADPDPAADRLDDDTHPLASADFYELMGMHQPISKQQNPRDLVMKHGLYARIHGSFAYTQTKYRVYDVLIYVFLVLQLFLSAVFIILGSLTRVESHIAIAVLGGISTIIAGTLALMKGQGLPNRLRQTRDALRNVVFEAEELYWDVGADRPVYYKDIKKVREDYLRVLEQARRNHPDTWNQTALGIGQGISHATPSTTAATKSGAATSQGWSLAPAATPLLAGNGDKNGAVAGAGAGAKGSSSAPVASKTDAAKQKWER